MLDIWSAGNYGSEGERTLRLTRPLCFLRSDPTDNGYARPIEGIRPVVDLNRMQVIRVEEYGVWPLTPQAGDYSDEHVSPRRPGIKPLEVTQPQGPGFTLQDVGLQVVRSTFGHDDVSKRPRAYLCRELNISKLFALHPPK